MKLGFVVPQFGPEAQPEGLVRLARRAEEIGYDSLWVVDRLLVPLAPRAPYPASPDGILPDKCRRVLDPLATLTFLAAHTRRVRLGSCILNLPYYNPVLLARELTTLDLFSGGRLDLGFGVGWSPDEFEAVGVPMRGRDARAEEALRLLKVLWTENPVEFRGTYYSVPRSFIDLKPVQKPHPPVYLAAFTPKAMARVARYADGWLPAGLPPSVLSEMWTAVRSMAADAGRDPETLKLVVLGNVVVSPTSLPKDRLLLNGNPDQIREDIEALRGVGTDELIFSGQFSPDTNTIEEIIARMEQLRGLAES